MLFVPSQRDLASKNAGSNITCPGAFADKGHSLRVATETGNVVLDPPKRQSLVVQPVVGLVSLLLQGRRVHEPGRSNSIAFNTISAPPVKSDGFN